MKDWNFSEEETEAIQTISRTPVLQSVLYDLDLLPEQLITIHDERTRDWDIMRGFVWLYDRLNQPTEEEE